MDARERFADAAVAWAAGGPAQPLVDAAAEALAAGVDSPTLRLLAGCTRFEAEAEVPDLAPATFAELGLAVHERRSTAAIVEAARVRSRRFLAEGGSPGELAKDLSILCVRGDYPDELFEWPAILDWYETDAAHADEIEAAIRQAAAELAQLEA